MQKHIHGTIFNQSIWRNHSVKYCKLNFRDLHKQRYRGVWSTYYSSVVYKGVEEYSELDYEYNYEQFRYKLRLKHLLLFFSYIGSQFWISKSIFKEQAKNNPSFLPSTVINDNSKKGKLFKCVTKLWYDTQT